RAIHRLKTIYVSRWTHGSSLRVTKPWRGRSSAAPEPLLQAAHQVGALGRGQDIGRFCDRRRDPLRRLLGQPHVIDAQRFKLGAAALGGGQPLAELPAGLQALLAQGPQIVGGALDDGGELLLLLAARVHGPAQAVDHALDPSRRQEPAAETTAAMPRKRAAAEATAAIEPAARAIRPSAHVVPIHDTPPPLPTPTHPPPHTAH